MIKAALNERNLCLIIVNVNMGTSGKEDERNLEYFQRPKLPRLQTFLQKRGIQTSLESNCYLRRVVTTDLRVWLERVYLLGILKNYIIYTYMK